MKLAEIAIETKAMAADKLYTYAVPSELDFIMPGCRVKVPFGRGNREIQGLVLSRFDGEADRVKDIAEAIDKTPLISSELCQIVRFMKERTFCTYFDAFKAALPTGCRIKLKKAYKIADEDAAGEHREILEAVKSIKGALFCDVVDNKVDVSPLLKSGAIVEISLPEKDMAELSQLFCRLCGETAEKYLAENDLEKHRRVIEMLFDEGEMPLSELCYAAGVSASVPKTLEKRGVLEIFENRIIRNPFAGKKAKISQNIELNEAQNKVFTDLEKLMAQDKPTAALLKGVTGSGKTLIYTKLCDKALSEGKDAILLLPEISLTPQFVERFYSRYGEKLALLHSGLSVGERYDEWCKIKSGAAKIVIGTRSAVFAPTASLGLIIIDEEQEFTYKSEMQPKYHARDIARFRAGKNNALLLLGSATPDIESYYKAKSGIYSYFELNERYNDQKMPEIVVADMREELSEGNTSIIGKELMEEINLCLEKKEQVILFLNRRGYNTHIGCPVCGYVAKCENCSISLTYHLKNNMEICHYCGIMHEPKEKCPDCGARLKRIGVGTQKAEEEISAAFPTARILRMDTDTTSRKNAHEQLIDKFKNKEYDILLGTQMIAKGHDIPNVTLAAVLFADPMIYVNDYRANERAYAMFMQVGGRAGRGEQPGKVIIQTFTPKNLIFSYLNKDSNEFFDEELGFRKLMVFPPFCDIYKLIVTAQTPENSLNAAKWAESELAKRVANKNMKNFIMFPATAAPIEKLFGKYRARILIKCKDSAEMRAEITNLIIEFNKLMKTAELSVERNPISVL